MRHVVVALLLVAALSGGAVAQTAPDVSEATTTFDVELRADGGADWTVRTSIPIDNADERAGFETYAEQYVAGESTAGPGIAFFERAATAASTTTDREMTIERVERDYTVGEEAGTLRLEFRWTDFLERDGEGYTLADALSTPEGTWLRSLGDGQELRIYTPPGYDIQRSSIEARQENESLVLAGPESFDPDEFAVVYQPEASAGTPTDSETPGGPDSEGIDGLVAALLGLLFLVVGVLAVWRWRGGESIDGAVGDLGDDGDGGSDAPEDGPDDAPAAGGSDPEPGVDPELLSDEERVEAMLERNGGRMRQAAIVEETDWSDAKVSQLLSRLADEGQIEKLRLGRENVISLPDEDEES